MPIANCIITGAAPVVSADDVVATWQARSGIESDEMTVNLIRADQGGRRYGVMAWLHLPSLWSESEVIAWSRGLAAALAETFALEPDAVHVETSILESGSVVESGRVLRW